jgi:hypothetical protein
MYNNEEIIMKAPQFKPTKWEVYTCKTCTHRYHSDRPYDYCVKEKHQIIKRPNIPFFIKEFEIDGVWYKGWWHLKISDDESFVLSPSRAEDIIKGCGIEKGGFIRNQWWMFCKCGSAMSLKWLPIDEDEEK